ncbi:MAG: ABC transporter ATP-binding protein [Clostridiales bacterium]|nr:ABC transporter ATP-binding protein [Clostridiales bacterium]
MGKINDRLKTPLKIVKIIAEYEPLYFAVSLPQIIVNTFLTLAAVYFPKLIIEQLTDGQSFSSSLTIILGYALALILLKVGGVILRNKSSLHAAMFSSKIKKSVGYNSMHIELSDIEDPKTRDIIRLAGRAADLTNTMGIIEGIVSDVIAILGLAWIVMRLDFLFILLVLLTLTAKTVFVRIEYLYTQKSRTMEAENNRNGDYLNHISYFNDGAEKEIRLNNLQNWFMKKVSKYRNTMLCIEYMEYKRTAFFNILLAVLVGIQTFLLLWILSKRYIGGIISIAEFTMYFSAVTMLSAQLSSVSDKIGKYNGQALDINEYNKLLIAVQATNYTEDNADGSCPAPEKTEIVFHDVSFSYPNTDKMVLEHISIAISDREKLVIAGANGSGKSTFIKLLCKFYRPTDGMITLNGTDIWDIPNDSYFQTISAVFQDFKNFSFTVRENITMSEESDSNAIEAAIEATGLSECIERLPNNLDTYLTRQFDTEGIELSGGQAQKLAIARAMYKNAPILILDEPTANLDPKAESAIYMDLFNAAKDKTTIFISHRLAASSVADKIAVFCEGKIIEYGTHESLMAQNGSYSEMYRKQSREYI